MFLLFAKTLLCNYLRQMKLPNVNSPGLFPPVQYFSAFILHPFLPLFTAIFLNLYLMLFPPVCSRNCSIYHPHLLLSLMASSSLEPSPWIINILICALEKRGRGETKHKTTFSAPLRSLHFSPPNILTFTCFLHPRLSFPLVT